MHTRVNFRVYVTKGFPLHSMHPHWFRGKAFQSLWSLLSSATILTLKKKKLFKNFILASQVLVAAHGIFSFSVWELVLRPGVKARPLHWECRVLVTAPPGKSFRPNFAVDSLCYFGVSHFHAQGLFSHLG